MIPILLLLSLAAAVVPRHEKVVHVFVVLCDNRNQGIAPVPEALGKGQDPASNLYWGARHGVKTFLTRSSSWRALRDVPKSDSPHVLERAMFVGEGGVIVPAEAYDGARMQEALKDFFDAAAGRMNLMVKSPDGDVAAGSASDLLCLISRSRPPIGSRARSARRRPPSSRRG